MKSHGIEAAKYGEPFGATPDGARGTRALPYSFRLPAEGERDPWFGGSRTFWKQLIRTNGGGKPAAVKSFTVQQAGAKRGVRFILYESARAYMAAQADQQAAA